MNDPAPIQADFRRDRWGRPLVVPAGETKAVPYTRSSSAAKTIEDTYNLELWARRNVVYGMANDPSLVARTLAIGGAPGGWDKQTKSAVNEIADDAARVAAAHKAADIGTAIHTLTEHLDRGQPVNAGPYQPDIDAYATAIRNAGLTIHPEYVECRMACDPLQLAGTADRILEYDGQLIIADLKTSATVDFGGLGWSAQLAAYAHSDLYDPTTDRRTRLDINKEWGIIIHLPAGQGTCTLHRVDLSAGYAAAELANQVRRTREQSRRWLQPLAIATRPDRRTTLRARYHRLNDNDKARFAAAGAPRDDLDAIQAVLDNIETPTPDEGDQANPDDIDAIRQRFDRLPDPDRKRLGVIVNESRAANLSFMLKELRSVRRAELHRGLIALAEHGQLGNDELIRQIAATATCTDAPFWSGITLGYTLGAMTPDEAAAFAAICQYPLDDITSLDLRRPPTA